MRKSFVPYQYQMACALFVHTDHVLVMLYIPERIGVNIIKGWVWFRAKVDIFREFVAAWGRQKSQDVESMLV